jgi:diadenosine tetraphosphate (Ap4A) HIT family hydrolase
MCVQGRVEESTFGTRIFAGQFIDAYAGKQAVQPGYAYAVWRSRHVTDITELTDIERAELWREVAIVADAMRAHYRPRKMNYEVLGNVVPYLHVHITARFADGDVAPGAPLPHRRDLDVRPIVWLMTLQLSDLSLDTLNCRPARRQRAV